MEGRTENNKVQIQCIPADGHISVQHSSPGGLELLSPNLCVLFDNGDAETRPAAPDFFFAVSRCWVAECGVEPPNPVPAPVPHCHSSLGTAWGLPWQRPLTHVKPSFSAAACLLPAIGR